MKQFLLTIFLFVSGYTFAQTLYTHNGAIPITEDSITFKSGKFRGTIQWQYSSDAQDWINIEDEVSDSLIVSVNDAGYYRAEIQDGICHQVYSDTALISSGSKNETGTFTDRRDGKTYKWVKIGKQVWMAENLAYLPAVSTSAEGSLTDPYYYVYGYEGTDVATAKATFAYSTYGALYNWPAAIEACPSGWHLPNENEWATLAKSLGGSSVAGLEMKTIVGWGGSITNSTNSSAFSALPGGSRNSTGGFLGISGNWWSDPLNDHATEAMGLALYPNVSDLISQKTDKKNGFSVRCVKDTVDVLILTVTVPDSVDADAVTLSFPTLKYNKKLIGSWTIDDNLSVWNLYCAINHKPIGSWPNFHLGEMGGDPDEKALEYTDGAGVKHRFAISMAVFQNLLSSIGRDGLGSNEWVTPKEIRTMQDFGCTTVFHDISSTGKGDDSFDQMISSNGAVISAMTDRFPKIMIEPNGDHTYITNSNANDSIVMTIAQADVVTKAKPFSENFTLDKHKICVQRDFYWSGLVNDFLTSFASQSDGTTAVSDRVWLIGGNHYISAAVEQYYFQQLEALYGASGSDILWFPSLDEFYEYWYLRTNTTYTKTVKGQKITFKLHTPENKDFWFKSLSVMLSGISDTTGVTVESSDNCNGTSYAMNDGKLLVNLDYNSDLITKAEKYLDKFKNSLDVYDMEDAKYFIQMLKPGVRETYQNELNMYISVPSLTGLSINAGADTTTSQSVSVSVSFSGTTTYYMISEDPSFTGASWKALTANIPFILNNTEGFHQIYLKLKNSFGESSVVSDSIYFKKVPFSFNSVSINNGDASTPSTAVKITLDMSGELPLSYKVSENFSFNDVPDWTTFTTNIIPFTLSSTLGKKTVYVKVKTSTKEVTKSDNILLTEPASLSSISLDSGAVSTFSRTVRVNFSYKGVPTHYMLSEESDFSDASWITFASPVTYELTSDCGIKVLFAKIKDATGVSKICSDTIELKMISPVGRKIIFSPVSENYEQQYVTLSNDTVINLCTTKQYEDYDNFRLKDVAGVQWATRIVKPSQLPSEMRSNALVSLGYRYPTLTGNTGPYPDQYIAKYFGIDDYQELYPTKRGLRILIEPGTYTLRVLFSTGSKETNDSQADLVYEANGVSAAPSGIALNNTKVFVELKDVVVGTDEILDFYIGQKSGLFAGFNLLEIIKTKL